MEDALTAQSCGVHVVCLPRGAGKTTAVCRVANDLLEQKSLLDVDLSAHRIVPWLFGWHHARGAPDAAAGFTIV